MYTDVSRFMCELVLSDRVAATDHTYDHCHDGLAPVCCENFACVVL